MSRSWWRVSSGCRTTKATVAADRATCRAPCQTFASSTSCRRSVTTTKFHGCQLLADAALRPASRMRSRSPRAIDWSVYWRTLRRARMVSQVSMSQLYACRRPGQGQCCRRWCAQNRGWPSSPGTPAAHNGKPNFRHPERFAATTNGLRTERTDHPLAAAEATGVSQSVATWTEIRDGGRVSEEDPLPSEEVGPKMRGAAEALRHVEDVSSRLVAQPCDSRASMPSNLCGRTAHRR
jgi:hypothetical protein